jgi:multisubunit Na+/H+ antiporter MnhC subunit
LSAQNKNTTSPRQMFLIGVFWLIISIPLAVILSGFAIIVFALGLIFMLAGYMGNHKHKANEPS